MIKTSFGRHRSPARLGRDCVVRRRSVPFRLSGLHFVYGSGEVKSAKCLLCSRSGRMRSGLTLPASAVAPCSRIHVMQTCRLRTARHCAGPGGGRVSHQSLRRHPTGPATSPLPPGHRFDRRDTVIPGPEASSPLQDRERDNGGRRVGEVIDCAQTGQRTQPGTGGRCPRRIPGCLPNRSPVSRSRSTCPARRQPRNHRDPVDVSAMAIATARMNAWMHRLPLRGAVRRLRYPHGRQRIRSMACFRNWGPCLASCCDDCGLGRGHLSDDQWAALELLLAAPVLGGPSVSRRRLIDGTRWRVRTGAPRNRACGGAHGALAASGVIGSAAPKSVVAAMAAWVIASYVLPPTVSTFAPFTALVALQTPCTARCATACSNCWRCPRAPHSQPPWRPPRESTVDVRSPHPGRALPGQVEPLGKQRRSDAFSPGLPAPALPALVGSSSSRDGGILT